MIGLLRQLLATILTFILAVPAFSNSYDNVGNLASVTYANGVVHSYGYDTRNRLTNLGVRGNTAAAGQPAAQGPIASYAYTLDAAGHRTSVSELSGRTVNYAYDNLYRLTAETIAGDSNNVNGAVSYTYDAVGNRTQKVSTLPGFPGGLTNYNANDQLSTDAYDANGNTTASGANSGSNGYVYDFENRLVQKGGISIVYDGEGNRVSKTVAGVTTTYLVDTQSPTGFAQVVQEKNTQSGAANYVYGLELISERRPLGLALDLGSTVPIAFNKVANRPPSEREEQTWSIRSVYQQAPQSVSELLRGHCLRILATILG